MAEKNIDNSDALKLRSWLPHKRPVDSFRKRSFFVVGVAALFTILFMAVDAVAGPTSQWLTKGGITLSSIFLGFALSTWWVDLTRGDSERAEAIRVDDRVEEEIQRVSENWQQTVHSLYCLPSAELSPDFIQAVRYFVGAQQNYVQGCMQRMALRIDQLGYDSQEFLKEKRRRFYDTKREVHELVVKTMAREGQNDSLVDFFNDSGPMPISTTTVENQRRASSTHSAAEDKAAKAQTEKGSVKDPASTSR